MKANRKKNDRNESNNDRSQTNESAAIHSVFKQIKLIFLDFQIIDRLFASFDLNASERCVFIWNRMYTCLFRSNPIEFKSHSSQFHNFAARQISIKLREKRFIVILHRFHLKYTIQGYIHPNSTHASRSLKFENWCVLQCFHGFEIAIETMFIYSLAAKPTAMIQTKTYSTIIITTYKTNNTYFVAIYFIWAEIRMGHHRVECVVNKRLQSSSSFNQMMGKKTFIFCLLQSKRCVFLASIKCQWFLKAIITFMTFE